jgi:hypothetical protein
MGFVSNTIKKIVFWNYSRTSWQWDVLCVLILVFIFLTPKSWFANASYDTHATQTTAVLGVEVLSAQPDNDEIGRRAREAVKRPNGRVLGIRPITEDGKIVRYEVDIR